MDSYLKEISENIVARIDQAERALGEEYLELMVSNILLLHNDETIDQIEGFEFDLVRSKHWTKSPGETLMFHDGITIENMYEAIEVLDIPEDRKDLQIKIEVDGLTDLEEPINIEFTVKMDYDDK
ncbi:MAG TPA: hypothetical protein ENN84_03670 [Candidatus Marinimicrobia bacterium]|nr:hypothetical protein [Candidatus Neomarinimicrobiota bacterium]